MCEEWVSFFAINNFFILKVEIISKNRGIRADIHETKIEVKTTKNIYKMIYI